jgi:pilus assembly protein CpaC
MLTLAMPDANIRVATMGINTVLLTGTVAAPEDAAEAERLVTAFMGDTTNVVSRLRMATPLQVNLRVRFAEVNRSLIRALGVNLTTYDATSGIRFGIGQGRPGAIPQYTPSQLGPTGQLIYPPLFTGVTEASDGTSFVTNNPNGGSTLALFGRFLGLDIGSAIDLAEQDGLSTTLAEPNLTALSGETAEFLAGGEFPIPLSQGLGTTTVEYKNYGVSLAYTPTVLANGRISLRVRPEVSELTSQGAVTLGGVQVPALTVRRAETTVELGSGQSFMIAGLLSNSSSNLIDKAPGVGDVPILGALFRSTNFQRKQTELVIVVTPYLVRPVDDSEIRLPTDGFQVPDPIQQYLLMKDNNGVTGGTRPMPRAAEGGTPPQVGQTDQVTPDQTADNRRRIGEETAGAEPASPGFSL